jgi:hypothetical protein
MTKVVVELPPDEAMALAQLVKRLGYDDAERLSSRYDAGAERDAMLAGVDKLQRALALCAAVGRTPCPRTSSASH